MTGRCCCSNHNCQASVIYFHTHEWNKRASCDKCDKIEKWADHAGFKPIKLARYEILLAFVRKINDAPSESSNWDIDAKELLKEIGESE